MLPNLCRKKLDFFSQNHRARSKIYGLFYQFVSNFARCARVRVYSSYCATLGKHVCWLLFTWYWSTYHNHIEWGYEIEGAPDNIPTLAGVDASLTAIPGAEAKNWNCIPRSRFRRTTASSRDASQSKSRSTSKTADQLAWGTCQGWTHRPVKSVIVKA